MTGKKGSLKQARLDSSLKIQLPDVSADYNKRNGGNKVIIPNLGTSISNKIQIPAKPSALSGTKNKRVIEDEDEDDEDIDVNLSEDSEVSLSDDDEPLPTIGSKRGNKESLDMSKLTKRQRMSLLSGNTNSKSFNEKQVTEIGRHNKEALLKGTESESVFFALGNK